MGIKVCMQFFCVGILFTSWIVCATEHRIRHQKFEEDNDPFITEEVEEQPETINDDIIDLDDTNYGMGLTAEDKTARKHAEDTREPGVESTGNRQDTERGIGSTNNIQDIEPGVKFTDIQDIFGNDVSDVTIIDNDFLSPVPLVNDKDRSDMINVTLPFNTSDDEDLGSGSGSGDIVIEIEDIDELGNTTVSNVEGNTEANITYPRFQEDTETEGIMFGGKHSHFYEYDSEDVEYIENTTDTIKDVEDQSDLPQYCKELFSVTWTPWSPWIQAGDTDFRFRSCPVKHGYTSNTTTCAGEYFETRKCGRREERVCRSPDGAITEEFNTQCYGIDIEDIRDIDELRNPAGPEDKCEYTLYDLQYNMAIGNSISSDQLHMADPKLWCFSDDKFVPFHTPTERCQNILKAFCTDSKRCKYDKSAKKFTKYKGDLHKRCWTDFVLGGLLPVGFPLRNGQQMICQKFDKESKLGTLFDHKTSQFATMYDTKQRIPVYSMVTVRSLGDDKWPSLPFMVDRSLIVEEVSTISWFFKEKKKGMTQLDELSTDCELISCKYGERQSLPSDYEFSGYRIAPLLTPDVIGWDLSRRVATFTMTNTAPMEPTVYSGWKRVMKVIREFAINECHIPVNSDNYGKGKPHNGYELPELYLISGAAPSMATDVEVIGNDVTVPEMFWTSVCCAHGAAVSSFGVYVYNTFEQKPAVVSVENLQMLLQANYYDNVDVIQINLYPAFDGVCSAPENDVSLKINL